MTSDPTDAAFPPELLESLFSAASDLDTAERHAFLEQHCAGQSALRRAVEDLLNAGELAARDTLWKSPALVHAVRETENLPGLPFDHLGPYRILSRIGIGGMGAVYLAERNDDGVRRQLAIKVVPYALASADALQRFHQERQILASFDHPNIARMLDAGRTPDGLPYLAMEYVDGIPIDRYVTQNKLLVPQKLDLFLSVCSAVSYAHAKLIVHRDLKPGNILVTASGIPKLLDFGVAKLLTDACADGSSTRVMTVGYASPEQLAGRPVTTAADVYSSGVVLWELLHQGRFQGHIAPDGTLDSDLEDILAKAVREEPEERYASIAEFSEDLRRYLSGHPVSARPNTTWYRTRKYARRHWVGLAVTVLAFAIVSSSAAVAISQARKAQRQFNQVRQLANRFLFDFHDAIADTPGTVKARGMVVATALEYLNRLAAESAGDPGLQWELVVAYGKVAAAEGAPSGPSLSRFRDAAASYQKALALARPIADQHRLSISQQQTLIDILCDAEVLYRYLKEYDSAALLGRQAVSRSAQLPPPARVRPLRELAMTVELTGDLMGSVSALEQALRVVRQDAGRDPGIGNRLRLASTLIDLGVVEDQLTRLPDAEASEIEAVSILKALRSAHPDKQQVLELLYDSLWRLGDVLGAGDRPSLQRFHDAAARYQEAIAVLAPLAASDPNDKNSLIQLSLRHNKIARSLADTDPARALEHARQAITLMDAGGQDRPQWRCQTRIEAAMAYRALRQFPSAERVLKEAAQFHEDGDAYTHADLIFEWARLEAAEGHPKAAAAWSDRAVAEMDQLYRKTSVPGYAWALTERLAFAANAHPESAALYRKRILETWTDQDRRFPGHPYIQQKVADARAYPGE